MTEPNEAAETKGAGPRSAALIGPYLSGKTTLLESLLFATGAIPRKGSVKGKNAVGDAAPEARARQMSIEPSLATADYLGDRWSFIDCPGSIELAQDGIYASLAADAAVVVVEPAPEKAIGLASLLRHLNDWNIPHLIFVNRMDTITSPVDAVVTALRAVSHKPLIVRELPIRDGETITGYVDLIALRAYRYQEGEASEQIEPPAEMADEIALARQELLESLADFDDALLEKLLEDQTPDKAEIFDNLSVAVGEAQIVPVLFGSAEHDNGVRRLLKALRHDVPAPAVTAARRGIAGDGPPVAQVFKTHYAAQAGKLSLARIWRGPVDDGATMNDERIGGLFALKGVHQDKLSTARTGDVVALARMESVKTGDVLTPDGAPPGDLAPWPAPLTPVFAKAIGAENRADEVKLTGALQRICEEDPSLSYRQMDDTHEMLLLGQGDIHLQLALDKLKERYGIATFSAPPSVPYKETIRKSVSQHGRFKRQTGGHGMFGDVHIDIKPLARGEGFQFTDKIVGGAVPKQYIPAVENGVKEFMSEGPLGFPVVDISVTLTDGQFHAVDSNEMSFKLAGRVAMTEGMPKCDPVLLEPILKVDIDVPAEFTNKVHGTISQRRGQILGFGPKDGWQGWDRLSAHMPQSEIGDLIVELRSLTLGVGTYHSSFDHLQELSGKLADGVVAARKDQKGDSAASA